MSSDGAIGPGGGGCGGAREPLRSAELNCKSDTRPALVLGLSRLYQARESAIRMATVVMKFGGTSVANIERIQNVARHVKREVDAGNKVAVVVSAMAGVTNQLVGWVKEASPLYDMREYDAVVATGEQVTAGLLAIVLQAMGFKARSWTGWQVPIKTNAAHGSARIADVPGSEIRKRIEGGEIAVVTGFQGIEPKTIASRRLAAADRIRARLPLPSRSMPMSATSTPMSTASTQPIRASSRKRGACRKSPTKKCWRWRRSGRRYCRRARSNWRWSTRCKTRVLSSFVAPEAMKPFRIDDIENIGTIVCDEEEIVEQQVVSGIAYAKDEAKVTLLKVRR